MSNFEKSNALYQRASQVIPGGVYGHQSPILTVPGAFPAFADRAEGPYYWDVDGNRYIDYMCGYGPTILGAAHPEVEEAVRAQSARGDCFNHPPEAFVQLAEKLVDLIDIADWAFFAKNGADTTRWAIRVAREATGRKTILRINHGYHGTDAWSSDSLAGVIEDDRRHVRSIAWNDATGLATTARELGRDLAAIIVTPYHHPSYNDSVFATDAFRSTIQEIQKSAGCLLILDDIRAGFRLHLGGSHRTTGWDPDLICFSKAIANGYALAACVGRARLKIPASRVFATGSFWTGAIALVAALKTLEILERENAPLVLESRGRYLVENMQRIGRAHGIELVASGPPALPFVRVADDPSFRQQQALCSRAAQEGLFLHPHHNWFLSLAHTEEVLEETLTRFERACRGDRKLSKTVDFS